MDIREVLEQLDREVEHELIQRQVQNIVNNYYHSTNNYYVSQRTETQTNSLLSGTIIWFTLAGGLVCIGFLMSLVR